MRRLFFAMAAVGLAVSCAGRERESTLDADASIAPTIRAADHIFGQQGIPVDEADERGGELRSGPFDPRQRWGGLADGRVTCGVDAAGVDLVHDARVLELELRVHVRPVSSGVSRPRTQIRVWAVGQADVEGRRLDCALVPEYRNDLVQAIAERAERTAVRF